MRRTPETCSDSVALSNHSEGEADSEKIMPRAHSPQGNLLYVLKTFSSSLRNECMLVSGK